jgi:hypothetical protein
MLHPRHGVFAFAHAVPPLSRLGSAGARRRPRRPVGRGVRRGGGPSIFALQTCFLLTTPAEASGHCSVGKTGGRKLARKLKNCDPAAARRRFLFPPARCSPSLTLNLSKGSHFDQVQRSSRGLCVLYLHTQGSIVPPGKPDGGTSPALRLRLPQDGGAGPSPRNHRHDRCSRWEELTGSMGEGKRAWIKGGEESLTMQE